MDFEETKQLIELVASIVADTDITEFSVEKGDIAISAKKGAQQVAVVTDSGASVTTQAPPTSAPEQSAPSPSSDDEDMEHLTRVNAPMVGTFYRAPDPESDPYVKEGDTIEVGQALCIIEAMKLMNEIESEVKGRIVRILVDDGEPVEYGEPLFLIEPHA